MLSQKVQDQRPFIAVLSALVILTWLALFVWEASPYGHYLDHDQLGESVLAGGEYLPLAGFFIGGWTLMTIAMMLPTALPLLLLFRRFVASRREAPMLVAVLIAGYLCVWLLFGALAHTGDLGLHLVVERVHWLEDESWAIAAMTVLLAGVYQFTPLKYFCLDKCRSPFSFIAEHWHGKSPRLEALRLGLAHGLFCIGCCWSLMLLMFAVGVGNVVWMLGLGAVMALEKNLPWGRRLSTPLGVVLVTAGVMLLVLGAASTACAHEGGRC